MSARRDRAAERPPGHEQMAGLEAKEGDARRRPRPRRRAPRRSRRRRPRARRRRRPARPPREKALIRSTIALASPVDVAREARAEQGVDHELGAVEGELRRRRGPARSKRARRSRRRRAARRAGRAGRVRRDIRAAQQPRRDEAVAAVVARAAQYDDASRAIAPVAPPRRRPRRPRAPSARCRAFRLRSRAGRPRPSRLASAVPAASEGRASAESGAALRAAASGKERSFHRGEFCYMRAPADPR